MKELDHDFVLAKFFYIIAASLVKFAGPKLDRNRVSNLTLYPISTYDKIVLLGCCSGRNNPSVPGPLYRLNPTVDESGAELERASKQVSIKVLSGDYRDRMLQGNINICVVPGYYS